MYSTCLHCLKQLGTNEVVEHFQIGERLAFDAAKGRLWVVCPHCARWNLTPIEERWEAVEECEKLFRTMPIRAQTDNIGFAKLRDGTELIRIGSPLRPEFAAWRYGGVFRDRLRKRVALGAGIGAAAIASGLMVIGLPVLSSLTPMVIVPFVHFVPAGLLINRSLVTTKVVGEDGKPLRVSATNLDHTRIVVESDALRLHLRHSYGTQELTGDRAKRALAMLLARVNRGGATTGKIRDASSFIANAGDPVRAIEAIARDAERRTGNFEERAAALVRAPRGRTIDAAWREREKAMRFAYGGRTREELINSFRSPSELSNPGALYRLPAVERLALEMALHEQSEQFALDAELASLERAWREAEEIAAIADRLLPVAPIKKPV